ncbi:MULTISPECIES: PEPxxWA-CTERM sorting domain-containing protein [unclassified Sphingobium]|uniref:PEPxxWA-CTERM sorting domain-containing protein n=1 Tax=unclassified Sphingobium TaxID=2611147 RepID=UPI002225A21A|nr:MULTISPECIES: PEPxxWA-CTERM sorting domain-containing protein [unclassified Sphingobium]MCW2393764.1 hypothetical protein [Sphingobium sp. B8D3B]MCW2417277.1 hypothetical protein [Sphingobium sp. B8D3C]
MCIRSYISAFMVLATASPAAAAVTFQMAGDSHATTRGEMPQAVAAATAFDIAAPGLTFVDFESPAPAGFAWSSGSITSVTPVAGCAHRCGFNTTLGGGNYLHFGSGLITFTFDTPINTFGALLTGLQNTLVGGPVQLSFNDGSAQFIDLPGVEGGGGAFVGFTTSGAVTSLSFYTRSDIVGFDDVRFGMVGQTSAVPEPATWAMMLGGFGVLGGALRRRGRRVLIRQPLATTLSVNELVG